MIFPDYLFKLTPRDEQTTPLESVVFQANKVAINSTTLSTDGYTVPNGKIFIPNSFGMEVEPGAAQNGITTRVYIEDLSSAATFMIYGRTIKQVANTTSNVGDFSNLLVMENYYIYAEADFDGFASANTFKFSMTGVLIPRGNFVI